MTARSIVLAATLILLAPAAAAAQAQLTPEQRQVELQTAAPKLNPIPAVTRKRQPHPSVAGG